MDRAEQVDGGVGFRDARACREALRSIDGVVHLAALAGVRPSIADPVRYMDVNDTKLRTAVEMVNFPGDDLDLNAVVTANADALIAALK